MKKTILCWLGIVLLGLTTSCRSLFPDGEPVRYAVAVSSATVADAGWQEVVRLLKNEHNAVILEWKASPREIQFELGALMPHYSCFVMRPEEISPERVREISRLCRQLDDDPWTDTFWGILTGYTPSDALRIVRGREPLVIRRAFDATARINLEPFDQVYSFDEFARGKMRRKADGQLVTEPCPEDNTALAVEMLCDERAQLVVTSAHATQNDWQMGYCGPNMAMGHHQGILTVTDTAGKTRDLVCPEPKVVIAAGNCLIGDTKGARDCMLSSWIHSGGARQFVGYTVPTWYGFMGWGTLGLFTSYPGVYSLTESFHYNNILNVMKLSKSYPEYVQTDLMTYDVRLLNPLLYWQFGGAKAESKDLLGLLFDRDVVAFYGDPAFDARIVSHDPAFSITRLNEEDPDPNGRYRIETFRQGVWPSEGVFITLPERIEDWKVTKNTFPCDAVFADNFIYLPLKDSFRGGASFELSFRARFASNAVQKGRLTDFGKLNAFFADPGKLAPPSETERNRLKKALILSGKNITEIMLAFMACADDEERLTLLHAVAGAREKDLKNLASKLWLDHVRYALKAWKNAPWREQVSPELFQGYILPLSVLDERSDNWRPLFYETFAERAFAFKTPAEAVAFLNKAVFKELDVTYHATKRPKPNQSPMESIEAKFASCTGLSVILADACRAVGIPARLVGCPVWTDKSGNHNWVEFWDNQWVYEGASHSDLRNRDWVGDKVRQFTDRTKWEHSVMAVAPNPQPGGRSFQMVWNPVDMSIPAVPVTDFYTDDSQETVTLPGKGKVLWIYSDGEPVYRLTGEGEKKIYLPRKAGQKDCARDDSAEGTRTQTEKKVEGDAVYLFYTTVKHPERLNSSLYYPDEQE